MSDLLRDPTAFWEELLVRGFPIKDDPDALNSVIENMLGIENSEGFMHDMKMRHVRAHFERLCAIRENKDDDHNDAKKAAAIARDILDKWTSKKYYEYNDKYRSVTVGSTIQDLITTFVLPDMERAMDFPFKKNWKVCANGLESYLDCTPIRMFLDALSIAKEHMETKESECAYLLLVTFRLPECFEAQDRFARACLKRQTTP
jgi:hypothetical protein